MHLLLGHQDWIIGRSVKVLCISSTLLFKHHMGEYSPPPAPGSPAALGRPRNQLKHDTQSKIFTGGGKTRSWTTKWSICDQLIMGQIRVHTMKRRKKTLKIEFKPHVSSSYKCTLCIQVRFMWFWIFLHHFPEIVLFIDSKNGHVM